MVACIFFSRPTPRFNVDGRIFFSRLVLSSAFLGGGHHKSSTKRYTSNTSNADFVPSTSQTQLLGRGRSSRAETHAIAHMTVAPAVGGICLDEESR